MSGRRFPRSARHANRRFGERIGRRMANQVRDRFDSRATAVRRTNFRAIQDFERGRDRSTPLRAPLEIRRTGEFAATFIFVGQSCVEITDQQRALVQVFRRQIAHEMQDRPLAFTGRNVEAEECKSIKPAADRTKWPGGQFVFQRSGSAGQPACEQHRKLLRWPVRCGLESQSLRQQPG